MKIGTIADGTSNTLLIGEKRVDPAAAPGTQQHHLKGYYIGWDRETISWGAFVPNQDKAGVRGDLQFGSSHPGGFDAVLCDGSVRSIKYSIHSYTPTSSSDMTPMGTWQRLTTRDDGLVLGDY